MESNDDMESLFEGMVLFNPTQPNNNTPTTHNHQTLAPPDPLDENLFSDLTLQTPIFDTQSQSQSDPSLLLSSPSQISTKQISTRKKKRAGLRIGYGRQRSIESESQISHSQEEDEPDEEASSSLASDSISVSSTSIDAEAGTLSKDIREEDNKEVNNEEDDKQVNSSSVSSDVDHVAIIKDIREEEENKQVNSSSVSSDAEPVALSEDIREEENKQVDSSSLPVELRFEQIKLQISEKLKHARELVGSVSATRKDTVRRRRKAQENLNLASANYREMEKELEEACEAEDFETADRVSESLALAEKEKELLATALRDAETECDTVDLKLQEVLQLQIEAEDECVSLLEIFSVDAANNADLALKSAEEKYSKEMSQLLSSIEVLETKKMQLEIESQLVNEARLGFNDSIEHSVKDDRIEKEELCKKKKTLTEELAELLALVKQKEAEIAENDCKIEIAEKRIAGTVSSFHEVQSSIDMKYDTLTSGLSEMELQSEALSRKKEEIDDFLSHEEGRGAQIKELARVSADEANVYREAVGLRKSLVQFISSSREDKVRLGKTAECFSEDVQMLKQEISAARASLQELSSTKSSFHQEIESFNQRLVFIDKRVPELEAEKKVAATARNFKEAARISTEAKTLNVEKNSIKSKMEHITSDLEKLEEEISETVKRLKEIEEQHSSKERELAMARYQRLLLISGAATAERLAALELGDAEEAEILLAEAEAADSEARKLEPTYNFKVDEELPKQFVSMELVSNLGGKQLAELAASARISTS